ncbi:MAG: hypothetical protein GY854_17775, partial [Deltaproteobacteria bacterium]|nr:hypothetical protein [Deltaproteobacteria bacterium]
DTDTDTDTDTDADADCAALGDFMDNCGAPAQMKSRINDICADLDTSFIDAFLDNWVSCVTGKKCTDFLGKIDGGPAANVIVREECGAEALANTNPGTDNTEFQTHVCEYLVNCDHAVDTAACEASDVWTEDLPIWKIVDQPFIGNMDNCVDPPPSCTSGSDGGPNDAGMSDAGTSTMPVVWGCVTNVVGTIPSKNFF